MASQRTSSGYNNPAYCSQHDYGQLMRDVSPGMMNHGKATYIATTAIDNYCYEEDEDMQLSTTVVRQQARQLVREPPIGASTTLRVCETSADNIPLRTTLPVSPKRNQPSGRAMDSPGSGHRYETIIISPRTPKKNSSAIVTSTPRKCHVGATRSPQRSMTLSPRRQQVCGQKSSTVSPVSTPRKAILPTSPTKSSVRNAKYVLPPQNSTPPHRSTAVIPPTYTCANASTVSARPLVPQKQQSFLATGVVCRKSPARIDASPGLKASWIHTPTPYQTPPTCTIATAGGTLLLCGAVSIVLCLYMMSQRGRRYYLDFGALSGFGSILLGCLGFRSRRWQWLPNRNYVSGYVILSMFSLLTCAGLIAILTLQPKPGEPLADVAGGAVCGISVLSLILTAFGVLSSRCCKYPPPDNRVEHCAEGFTL